MTLNLSAGYLLSLRNTLLCPFAFYQDDHSKRIRMFKTDYALDWTTAYAAYMEEMEK